MAVGVLIAGALSVGLLSVLASPADAATISPTSANLGRVVVHKTGAPVTFTVTKDPNESHFNIYPRPGCGCFVVGYTDTGGITDQVPQVEGACATTPVLNAGTPSCTITVALEPEAYGVIGGGVAPNYDSLDASADLTGVGLLPRKSPYCRKGVHSNRRKFCQKRRK